MKVELSDIKSAYEIIKSHIRHTECLKSNSLSQMLGQEIYLKLENTQHTGSFKLRGALNKIFSLTEQEKKQGVVASSAGNHAQGVAFGAQLSGVKCKIVMPVTAPLVKVEATKSFGAEVIQKGEIYDEAFDFAKQLEKSEGLTFVHPFEDPKVIAGQGTLGIEMLKDFPEAMNVIVPVGGGGLISGIAVAIKSLKPNCRVIGVQSALVDSMVRLYQGNLQSKSPVTTQTIADGIAVKRPSEIIFSNFIKKYVDEMVTVTDDEIAEAIVFLMEKHKSVAEGAGAAAVAAVLSKKVKLTGPTIVLVCGGNIDLNMIEKILSRGLIRKGRLIELSVIVDDAPGNLNKMTAIIAQSRANILEVHHDRVALDLELRQTRIDFVLETTSSAHADQIRNAFKLAGARIVGTTEVII